VLRDPGGPLSLACHAPATGPAEPERAHESNWNEGDFYWQTINSADWHPEVVADAGSTYSAPSVAQVGNSSVITADGGGLPYYYWQTIGTVPWTCEVVDSGDGTNDCVGSVTTYN
jgi:hypothetical protein